MKPTRQRIQDYLASHNTATARELSQALLVTPSDVRYHLGRLVDLGSIVPTGEQPVRVRGRPAQRYRLVSRDVERNYILLTNAILDEILSDLSPSSQEGFLHRVATRLTGIISEIVIRMDQGESHPPGKESAGIQPVSLSVRLVHTVQRLAELGYHSRWEAHREAPRLIIEHSPFTILLTHRPEVYQLENYLFKILLGTSVTQITHLEHNVSGEVPRVYLVGK